MTALNQPSIFQHQHHVRCYVLGNINTRKAKNGFGLEMSWQVSRDWPLNIFDYYLAYNFCQKKIGSFVDSPSVANCCDHASNKLFGQHLSHIVSGLAGSRLFLNNFNHLAE